MDPLNYLIISNGVLVLLLVASAADTVVTVNVFDVSVIVLKETFGTVVGSLVIGTIVRSLVIGSIVSSLVLGIVKLVAFIAVLCACVRERSFCLLPSNLVKEYNCRPVSLAIS